MRASLAQLNALGLDARRTHHFTVADVANGVDLDPIFRARQAQVDAGLRALGIEPHHPDSTGSMHGQPHDWYTAQLADGNYPGLICGRWSGSLEQAIAELAEGHGVSVAWAVRDDYPMPVSTHYRAKYRQRATNQTIAPVTAEPEPVEAPAPRVVQEALF